MTSHLEKCRQKLKDAYVLAGLTADVAQLCRAHLRDDSKGVKRNIDQIIKKLGKVKSSL